jgi:hypothetical protein
MKMIYKYLIVILILTSACRPDEFPGIGQRDAKVPLLAGTWTIESVTQFDNDAQRKGFPFFAQSQGITSDFAYDEFSLTLNLVDGEPSTFSIVTGASPNIIGDVLTGTWTVDDLNFPGIITFTDESEATLQLGSLSNLAEGTLSVKVIRNQLKSGKYVPVVTYNYVLSKTE